MLTGVQAEGGGKTQYIIIIAMLQLLIPDLISLFVWIFEKLNSIMTLINKMTCFMRIVVHFQIIMTMT